MKNVYFFFLLIAAIFTNAQMINGKIFDSISKENIKFANVVLMKGDGVSSDDNGKFQIITNNSDDILKVSSTGYEPKFISLKDNIENFNNLNIYLTPKFNNIEEVKISNKSNFTEKVIVGEKRESNISLSTLIGHEIGIFISNPKEIKGKINRVYVDLKQRDNADDTAIFNVKFYEYDKENNVPGKELSDKNIFVQPKNKKYRLWIDVENKDIVFPKEGICVSVQLINPSGKVDKNTKFGPAFRYTESNDKKFIVWSNFYNRGWKLNSIKSNKVGIGNPMIGIEVLFPNKIE